MATEVFCSYSFTNAVISFSLFVTSFSEVMISFALLWTLSSAFVSYSIRFLSISAILSIIASHDFCISAKLVILLFLFSAITLFNFSINSLVWSIIFTSTFENSFISLSSIEHICSSTASQHSFVIIWFVESISAISCIIKFRVLCNSSIVVAIASLLFLFSLITLSNLIVSSLFCSIKLSAFSLRAFWIDSPVFSNNSVTFFIKLYLTSSRLSFMLWVFSSAACPFKSIFCNKISLLAFMLALLVSVNSLILFVCSTNCLFILFSIDEAKFNTLLTFLSNCFLLSASNHLICSLKTSYILSSCSRSLNISSDVCCCIDSKSDNTFCFIFPISSHNKSVHFAILLSTVLISSLVLLKEFSKKQYKFCFSSCILSIICFFKKSICIFAYIIAIIINITFIIYVANSGMIFDNNSIFTKPINSNTNRTKYQ